MVSTLDAHIGLEHQLFGLHHQPGVAQVDRLVADALDDDGVAHQPQGAKHVIPDHFLDTTDQFTLAERDYVLGGRRLYWFEAQGQRVVIELTGRSNCAWHILEDQGTGQVVHGLGCAEVDDGFIGPHRGPHHQRLIAQACDFELVAQVTQPQFPQQHAAQPRRITQGIDDLKAAGVVDRPKRHRPLHHQLHRANDDVDAIIEREHQRSLNT